MILVLSICSISLSIRLFNTIILGFHSYKFYHVAYPRICAVVTLPHLYEFLEVIKTEQFDQFLFIFSQDILIKQISPDILLQDHLVDRQILRLGVILIEAFIIGRFC